MARRTLADDAAGYVAAPGTRRGWVVAAQDGIISTAGILLGFAGAGANEVTLIVAGKAAIVAGMLTAGGAKWSEIAAEREAQLRAIADERHQLRTETDRAADRAALARHLMDKGLGAELAAAAADELLARNRLKAVLELEHGVARLISPAEVAIGAAGAALAFALGASIPLAIAWYLPVGIEMWVIVVAVLASLTLISVAGARAGKLDVGRTLRRTLIVASVTIVVSYLAGGAG